MSTSLERHIEYEDRLRMEIRAKFPTLDADWAVYRAMEQIETAQISRVKASMPVLNVVAERMVEEIKNAAR